MPASLRPAALTIEKLTVGADRVTCRVRVNPGAPRMTTPALAAAITRAYPTLPLHSCVNEHGDTFAAVLNCTSLPHVLEHLVIDEQVRAEASREGGLAMPSTKRCSARAGQSSGLSERAQDCLSDWETAQTPPPETIYTGTTRWLDETAGVAEVQVSYADDLVALKCFQTALHALNKLVVM